MKTKIDFKNNGKSLLTILIVSFLMLSGASVIAQNPNFTGSWKLNESKSTLPEMGFRRPATKITVKQDNIALNADRVSAGRDGEERVTKEKVTLDGKVSENVVMQDRTRKSTATWSADGKVLEIKSSMTFDMNGETREMKSSEKWKLSADKNTLTIEAITDGRDGEIKSTLVYDIVK
jgi:hypothetical protein